MPVLHFSHIQLFEILQTAAHQALSMGCSRQEHWSGLPCPPPGDLPYPGIEPTSPALQVDSLPLNNQEAQLNISTLYNLVFCYSFKKLKVKLYIISLSYMMLLKHSFKIRKIQSSFKYKPKNYKGRREQIKIIKIHLFNPFVFPCSFLFWFFFLMEKIALFSIVFLMVHNPVKSHSTSLL